MGRARWLSFILTLAVLLGSVSGVTAQRPDAHRGASNAESRATPETPGAPDCDLVEGYTDDLWTAIDGSGAFITFLFSEQSFGDITEDEAEEIIAAADDLIDDIQSLDVPSAYAPGHEGIIQFFRINSDFARFYALDSSIVPDLNAYDQAWLLIAEGEIALVSACPDEVDAVGGYVMFDPDASPIDDEA